MPMSSTAKRRGSSNGGIADFYVVFVRTGEAPGSRGISAIIVDANTSGFEIAERIRSDSPTSSRTLEVSTNCRVPVSRIALAEAGQGFKIAMATLDVFRTSVAAAALGFARRALEAALRRATSRKMFGQALADFQLTQAKLAQMATEIDAAALLTYRAAWSCVTCGHSVTVEAAMAKMTATETAQRVIDDAVQIFGGQGVVAMDEPVEQLCIAKSGHCAFTKALTEVQQLIIARA